MKTAVKKIDSVKREVSVELSGDIIKNKFEDAFKKISQEAKVSGFRPGHVPRDILEKKFSAAAEELVLKELLPEVYRQAIEKEALNVAELPKISDIKLERNALSFKAEVEIMPEIKLKEYRMIKLNYKKINVSPEEIKRQLEALKESRKLDNLDDKFARSLGYPALSDLEKMIEMQAYLQKENQQRKKLEEELIESLLKDLDFKVPQSMLNKQQEELLRQAKIDLALRGLSPEKIKEQEQALADNLKPAAARQVKVYLILSEIAKRENIAQNDEMPQRVMELLLGEASWQES